MSGLIIIDSKFDTPSQWARENKIAVIHPVENHSKSDFVSQVNEQLNQCATLIQKRQAILYDNPNHQFTHLTIVIDEVLALSEGVNKNIKEAFFPYYHKLPCWDMLLKSIYSWKPAF